MLKVKTIRLLILHSSRGSEAPSSGYWLRRVFSWLLVTQDISWAAGKLGCWWGLQSLTGLTETGESTAWFTRLAFGRSQLLPGWFSQRERERQRDPGGFLSWLLPYGCGTVGTSLNGWTRVPSLVEGADCHSNYLLGRMWQRNGTWTVLTAGLGTESALHNRQQLLWIHDSAIHCVIYLVWQRLLNHRARWNKSSLYPRHRWGTT